MRSCAWASTEIRKLGFAAKVLGREGVGEKAYRACIHAETRVEENGGCIAYIHVREKERNYPVAMENKRREGRRAGGQRRAR